MNGTQARQSRFFTPTTTITISATAADHQMTMFPIEVIAWMQSPPQQVCGTWALSSQKKEVGRVCSSQP